MGPAKNAKVDVVHVRHKTSEKELVIDKSALKKYNKMGYLAYNPKDRYKYGSLKWDVPMGMEEGKLTEKVKYKKDKKIGGKWYTKQGTHKHQMKANIIAKREFGRYYDTKVVKEKGGYTIYVKPLKEGKLNEGSKVVRLPNGIKVKIDFKGLTFIGGTKPVFLDRTEMMNFFKATAKYLR